MESSKSLIPILFYASLAWGELPLLAPIVRQPVVVSCGEGVIVSQLPWRWMTWNLQWFPGHLPHSSPTVKDQHIQSVGMLFKKIRPQVGLLQEVLDSADLERASSGYPWRVITNFQRAGDEDEKLPPQNVAMISQWPWKEVWEVDFDRLPLTPDRPVRGFLGVKFQNDQGQNLTAYGIHLKSNRGGRDSSAKKRERAMDYLRWDWQRRGLDPKKNLMLVAGDFNCSTRNPEFSEGTIRNLMREGWALADGDIGWPEGATVKADPRGRFPASDFDHFLLSPGLVRFLGVKKQDVKIFSKGEIPSDHYPVELLLSLKW